MMPKFPLYNNSKDEQLFKDECNAYDENRWYDMIISIRDRVMTRKVHKQLCHSLRECRYNLSKLVSLR